MSNSNNIKLLLDIQDKNIEIGENAVELRSYQGRMAKFITAKLTYTTAFFRDMKRKSTLRLSCDQNVHNQDTLDPKFTCDRGCPPGLLVVRDRVPWRS